METGVTGNLPASDEIAAFRRFNRLYTRFIGTLQEGLLDTPYSFSEARVLYELATRRQPFAKEIAQELGMDAGYLSRMLSKFEEAGLLKRAASLEDGRQAHLTLTKEGRGVFRNLNARSDQQARSIFEGLAPASRRDLIQSMRTIEEILNTKPKERAKRHATAFTLRHASPGRHGLGVHREGLLYTQEYGWDGKFEALAARVVADFIEHFDPACERCWIAERDGENLGHIFLVKHPEREGVAKLRLLLVEPWPAAWAWPCAGGGVRPLRPRSRLPEDHALDPEHSHRGTSHLPEAGFQLVHEEPHHSFGKDLSGRPGSWTCTERVAKC